MAPKHGIRKPTRRAIYDFIREQGMATKNELAAALDLSLPTVTKYLTHFIDDGIIEQGPKMSSGSQGGRSPIAYTCLPNGRYAVGVDITRDLVTCLVVNLEREVVAERQQQRAFELTDDYFAAVAADVEAIIAESQVDRNRVLGVGIAVPGLISEVAGTVTYGRVLFNEGLSAADFGRHLNLPVRLVHDSDAAGLAEFWTDSGQVNAFYVSLSRSVGGSVLIRDEIYRGDGEFAGEIGHLLLHEGGGRCYCGQDGCVDVYCNARVLTSLSQGSIDGFFALLDAGEPKAVATWERYTHDLARVIHNLRVLFGCTIILGGDVGARIRGHMDGLCAEVDRLSFLASAARTFVVPCDYTRHPVATGAALYFVGDFRQSLGPSMPRPVLRSPLHAGGVPIAG